MHNNIMAAGSKDRPPMLGPGRYSQWRPYTPTSILIAAVEAAENITPVVAHEEAKTIHNMTTENKLYFQAEKEAIFLILTGWSEDSCRLNSCKVSRRFNHRYSLSDETSSGIVSDEEIDKQKLEAHYSYMAKIQEVSPEEFQFILVAIGTSVDQMRSECVDERAALANLIANLTLDTEENKTILKQLKKENASLTQELKECKTNLDEYSKALGEGY
ncbi:hypothetical protein Tco_0722759 [Tanacetum coccineum]